MSNYAILIPEITHQKIVVSSLFVDYNSLGTAGVHFRKTVMEDISIEDELSSQRITQLTFTDLIPVNDDKYDNYNYSLNNYTLNGTMLNGDKVSNIHVAVYEIGHDLNGSILNATSIN